MSDFSRDWLKWLYEGLELMPASARGDLLANCGKRCAQTGVIETYRAILAKAGGDADSFFGGLTVMEGVSGRVAVSGREYEIAFDRCLCDMYTDGYVDSPALCDCSRGSIMFVMHTLFPNRDIAVSALHTILGGAYECRFRITMNAPRT